MINDKMSVRRALCLFTFAIAIGVTVAKRSGVKLIANGYTGVVVAIHADVVEDDAIVEGVKRVLTSGSKQLYDSTKRRAYFKEVTILIPPTWSQKAEYLPKEKETYSGADFVVAPKNNKYGNGPYVKSFGGCGDQGEFVHLTPAYLTQSKVTRDYGNVGKVVVHEWGHYRWGLQEEYPEEGDQQWYYSTETKQYEAVRCSLSTKGKIIEVTGRGRYKPCQLIKGRPTNAKCRFYPGFKSANPSKASLMYRQGTTNVDQYCDSSGDENHRHNDEAPNRMNRLCEGKSSWEVMLEHEDFREANPPRDIKKTDILPKFKVVKAKKDAPRCRISLVLDISGSMDGDKLEKMNKGLQKLIRFTLNENTEVGTAFFSSDGEIRCGMRKLTDERSRINFVNRCLPPDTDGSTSIGSGLLKGVENLGRTRSGDRIMLLTDGIQNIPPGPKDYSVITALNRANVFVDTISFTKDADASMVEIAKAFGGNFFFDSNNVKSNSLNDAFAKNPCGDDDDDVEEKKIALASDAGAIGTDHVTDSVNVDSSVGRDTKFIFDYGEPGFGKSGAGIRVTLTSPSGKIYSEKDDNYEVDSGLKTIIVSIPENAEMGRWDYVIRKTTTSLQTYKVNVLTKAREIGKNKTVSPLTIYSSIKSKDVEYPSPMTIYVEATRGGNPVLRLQVFALIDRPGEDEPLQLELRDDGRGADASIDDGVYSRYFSQFTAIGQYSTTILVSSTNDSAVRVYKNAGFSGAAIAFDEDNIRPLEPVAFVDEGIEGNVSRSTTAGASELKTEAANVAVVDARLKRGVDEISPDRIVDLRLVATSLSTGNVTLTFTATGDDYDEGNVTGYRFLFASNDSRIFNGSEERETASTVGPGETETMTFNVQPPDAGPGSYRVVVVGVDEAGNVGRASNAVTFGLGFVNDVVDGNPVEDEPVQATDDGSEDKVVVIVAIVIVIVIVIVLYVILMFVRHRLNKSEGYRSRRTKPQTV